MSRGYRFFVAIAGLACVALAPPPSVLATKPQLGAQLAARQLAVVRVPDLPADANFAVAPRILQRAGLQPGKFLWDRRSGQPGTTVGRVTGFSPPSGTMIALGSKVDMFAIQGSRCLAIMLRPDVFLPTRGGRPRIRPTVPVRPPTPTPDVAFEHHDPTAISAPATDTGPGPGAPGPDEAAPPAEGPAIAPPFTGPQKGRGAFVNPGDMEVNNWHRLEFVVGKTDAALAEESEDQELGQSKDIYVAPLMRVTLEPDPNFEIRRQSPDVQETGADRAASWQWSVKPLSGGSHALIARVEVLEKQSDGSLVATETYTRRLAVTVHVGTWQGFLNALRGAASFGDLLATLFGSWGKTLTALTALIAAAVGLWAAIRKLRKPKE